MAKRRPCPHGGKAVVVWEATGRGTTRAAGVGVQARRDRCAEIMSGKSSSQQGLTATCTDPRSEGTTEAEGGWRTGACVRKSDDSRVTPVDVVSETTTSEVTPGSCKGALGTWQLQEYPDMEGRGTMERPWQQTIE